MNYNMENNWKNKYVEQSIEKNNYKKRKNMPLVLIILILLIVLAVEVILFEKILHPKSSDKNVLDNKVQNNQITNSNIKNEQKEEKNTISIGMTNLINSTKIEDNSKNEINNKDKNKDNQNQDKMESNSENKIESKSYDYSKPVPTSKKVDSNYFSDAVFIGDSRTEGFMLNNGLSSKTKAYTSRGLKVDTIFTDRVINMNGKKVTIIDALKQTSFSKVYIMLGINETGWVYSNLFIKKYGEIIDTIREINPNSTIYVQSILPVSQKVSSEHSYIKNSRINEYNSLIMKMANDKKVYYIDAKQAVANENGALPEEAATDGIHLNKRYCQKWLEYLKNHIVEKK